MLPEYGTQGGNGPLLRLGFWLTSLFLRGRIRLEVGRKTLQSGGVEGDEALQSSAPLHDRQEQY